MYAELPILASFMEASAELERATDEGVWKNVAAFHRADAQLDAASRRLLREKLALKRTAASSADACAADSATPSTKAIEENFAELVALDTVRNEFRLHARLHEWFAKSRSPLALDSLNERVYAELFLTPSSDPWLGLLPADAYAALPCNGVVYEKQ